jgi:hypothetical protein
MNERRAERKNSHAMNEAHTREEQKRKRKDGMRREKKEKR